MRREDAERLQVEDEPLSTSEQRVVGPPRIGNCGFRSFGFGFSGSGGSSETPANCVAFVIRGRYFWVRPVEGGCGPAYATLPRR